MAATILHALLSAFLFLWVFYGLYGLVMGVYRAHLSDKLKWYHYCLLGPWVAVGFTVDVVGNITLAAIIFWEIPKEWLVTTRLTRYRANGTPYQRRIAVFICDNLLDPFDPTEDHC